MTSRSFESIVEQSPTEKEWKKNKEEHQARCDGGIFVYIQLERMIQTRSTPRAKWTGE